MTFIFDFDSTIFPGESLDELLHEKICTASESVAQNIFAIGAQGMNGTISMEKSLRKRLELAGPTNQDIANYVSKNSTRIDAKIITLLKNLQLNSHAVFVVSGGFEEWIIPFLDGIVPAENIFANKINDPSIPMAFDNIMRFDKEELILKLKNDSNNTIIPITIIGDGATDFSVYENGLAQHFIGTFFYTGLANRKQVIEKAIQNNQPIFSDLNVFLKHLEKFTTQ